MSKALVMGTGVSHVPRHARPRTTSQSNRVREQGPRYADLRLMQRLFSRARAGTVVIFVASVYVLSVGGAARSALPKPLPTLVVSAAGSDQAACTKAAPCFSINAAYRHAQPGQTVQVEPGIYPQQRIRPDPKKNGATKRVIVTATPGA